MRTKLIGFAVIAAILFAFGFRVAHPVDGLSSAMGAAKSSVVIYKHSGSYAVGNKVVVTVAGQGTETGIVKAATDKTVDVDTKSAFVRVNQEEVHGRLLVVIPFFGKILSIIHL